jgi:single-strand DNA-binding protein
MINKVTLIGNLGADPEIRTLENGTSVGRFSLATNEAYKDKDGNWQKQTEWHNVVVWRELAERAQKSLIKGDTCYVEGKITYRKFTDKDGVERHATDIVASVVRSLEKKGTEDATARNFTAERGAPVPSRQEPVNSDLFPTYNSPKSTFVKPETDRVEPPSGFDDLPF